MINKKVTIIIQQARIETLERLLCPQGHTFKNEGFKSVGGTGKGDEDFYNLGFCTVCHKRIEKQR